MDSYAAMRPCRVGDFKFLANRYEMYQDQRKTAQGNINSIVHAQYSDDTILVHILNNKIYGALDSDFVFDAAMTLNDRILLYSNPEESNVKCLLFAFLKSLVSTTRKVKYYKTNEPVACSIYTDNGNIFKVTFTMANPDRLIELF